MSKKTIDQIKTGDAIEQKNQVGKYMPIYYAGASGDFNPIHIDNDFAKMVGLGGVILQGLCTMAFVTRACTDFAGDPGALKRIKVRFAKPVRPDDDVTVKGTVTQVEGDTAHAELGAVKQDGEEVITMAFADFDFSDPA